MAAGLPFEVSWSGQSLATARTLLEQARIAGRANDLARIFRTINDRLQHQPLAFGEVYRSRGVVHEHLAVCDKIAVDFAIDTQSQFVLVRRCQALTSFGK